jgi:hypothetical protein
MNRKTLASAILAAVVVAGPAQAQVPAEVDACKASGLIALKEQSPTVKDLEIDPDSLTVSKTTAKIEDIQLRTIVMGDAYVERGKGGKPYQLLCIIGEKGKVLLTFFTKH